MSQLFENILTNLSKLRKNTNYSYMTYRADMDDQFEENYLLCVFIKF